MAQELNGGCTAENVVDLLNAHERSLRWREEQDEEAAWEIARTADHFSVAGTDILRRCRPHAREFVVDDGDGGRYVVACDPPRQPKTLRRGKLRSWSHEAPIFLYELWQAPCGLATGDERPQASRKLYIGGLGEFVRWLGAIPVFSRYTDRPVARWYVAASADSYYVEPNFYEKLERSDIADLSEHYPEPVGEGLREWEPEIHPSTGRVSFVHPDAALRYAEDLKRAMDLVGVICSPSVGIAGYTDSWRDDPGAQPEPGAPGLPAPDSYEAARLVHVMRAVVYHRQRCLDLEARLDDPRIPDQRKARIARMLREEAEAEQDALEGLTSTDPALIYGLTLYLADERDRLQKERDLAEIAITAKTRLLERLEAEA